MGAPQILVPENAGIHNSSDYATRLEKEKTYRDLSTVIVCPTRGMIPARIVQSWQDPTHNRAISEASFLYLNKQWRVDNLLDHYPVDFDFSYGYVLDPAWQNRSASINWVKA